MKSASNVDFLSLFMVFKNLGGLRANAYCIDGAGTCILLCFRPAACAFSGTLCLLNCYQTWSLEQFSPSNSFVLQ